MTLTFEVCIDSVASAIVAEKGGGTRLELCDNLVEGGTTPSLGMVETVKAHVQLPIMAMIRPRGGDFLYSELEFEAMKRDIKWMKKVGVHGVVFGLLTADGEIDIERTQELVALARPLKVTFHRAFDMVKEPMKALDILMEIGVDTVLTSGQANDAYDGRTLIGDLVKRAAGRIKILPGGGIDEGNVGEILTQTGVEGFHAAGIATVQSAMKYQKQGVYMGLPEFSEFELKVAAIDKIHAMRERAEERSI